MANINKNIIMQAGAAVANATNRAAGLSASTPEPGSIISVIQLVNGGRTIGPVSLAHFTESVRNKLLSLLVNIELIQSGSGTPSPDNVRPISGRTGLSVYDDPKYGGTVAWNQLAPAVTSENWDKSGSASMSVEFSNGEAICTNLPSSWGGIAIKRDWTGAKAGHKYLVSSIARVLTDGDSVTIGTGAFSNGDNIGTVSSTTKTIIQKIFAPQADRTERFNISNRYSSNSFAVSCVNVFDLTDMFGSTIADYIYSLEQATEGAGVAWFRNLFPKDYYPYDNSYTETCVSAVNGDPYWKKDIDWTSEAGAVYAGSADIVSGDIKAAPYYASYNGETLVGPWVSSMDVYDPEGTPTTGAQVVDLGGTMTEYHITGQDIITLVGDNCIWSDSGDVTITE